MSSLFCVVAFPVCEWPEQRRYVSPTKTACGYETIRDAQESAKYANLIDCGVHFTYEAMSHEEFNNLDWPTIKLTY